MFKFILNTAVKTLAACITAIFFIFNIAAFAFPGVTSEFFDKAGIEIFSIPLCRAQYERSGDINDLGALVEMAIKYEDYPTVLEYVPELKNHEEYDNFAAFKNAQGVSAVSDYKNYVDGNYLIALFNKNEKDKCLSECAAHLAGEYLAGNPVRFLVRFLSTNGKSFPEFVSLLENKYNSGTLETVQKKDLCVDIYSIYLGLQDADNMQYWKNEYQNCKNT